MVVDELSRLAELAVSLRLGQDRPDHLRVAVVAAFCQVDVAPVQLQRRVRLDAGDRRHVRANQERGDNLEQRRDGDGDRDPHREQQRQPLPALMPPQLRPLVHPVRHAQHGRSLQPRLGLRRLGPVARQRRRVMHRFVVMSGPGRHRLPAVDAAEHAARQIQRAADHAQPVHRHQHAHGLDEIGISQIARAVDGAPHQSLRQPCYVDWNDVQQDTDRRNPEMQIGQFLAEQRGLEHPGDQPVQHAERHEPDPAQRAGVDVGDRPVRVVRQGVDALDRKQRPLERRHPVERDADHEELQDRLLGDLRPGSAQRHQPVDHAAPRGHPEHDREQHAQGRSPLGQRGVVQMVRTGPDIDEDQRPKMQDAQPVRKHRTPRGLGQVVVHDPQERRRQQEPDGVVAVPPLHERILDPGVQRVALEPTGRHRQAVEDVQHGDGDDGRNVEPQRHVHVPFPPPHQGAEEIDREPYPDHGDGDVDRPLQLGVLLAAGETGGQRQRRGHNDQLPTPEIEPGQEIAEHAGFAQPLRRMIDGRKHCIRSESEDRGVRVQRTQTAERHKRQPQIHLGQRQLNGHDQAHQKGNQPPENRGQQERPHDTVVVNKGFQPGHNPASIKAARARTRPRFPCHRHPPGLFVVPRSRWPVPRWTTCRSSFHQ